MSVSSATTHHRSEELISTECDRDVNEDRRDIKCVNATHHCDVLRACIDRLDICGTDDRIGKMCRPTRTRSGTKLAMYLTIATSDGDHLFYLLLSLSFSLYLSDVITVVVDVVAVVALVTAPLHITIAILNALETLVLANNTKASLLPLSVNKT